MINDKLTDLKKVAKDVGKIQMKYFKKDFEVNSKTEDFYDPVTMADKESHTLISKRIRELFPQDQILSEEGSHKDIDFSKRVWIVDPLDGTKEFFEGNDNFVVMIGLCINGTPGFGLIYEPISTTYYYSEKGKGAWIENESSKSRLKVSSTQSIQRAIFLTRTPKPPKRPLDDIYKLKVKGKVAIGSVGSKVAILAKGEADFHVQTNYKCSKWDTCAPEIILEEAGGRLTDLYGEPINYKQKDIRLTKSFVASNGVLHEKVLKEVSKIL